MQLFPKHWEFLVTPSHPPPPPPLQFLPDALRGHLYANACVYALHSCLLPIAMYNIYYIIIITIFHTVHVWCARIWAQ